VHDREEAARAGISGTPSYIVNGRVLHGSVPYGALRQAVASELAAH